MVVFPWLVPATILFWGLGGDIAVEGAGGVKQSKRNESSHDKRGPYSNPHVHRELDASEIQPK